MFEDYIRYIGSLVMIKEVTLNAEGMYLNVHRLICMLSSKYEIGEHGNSSDHKAELCHRERKALPKSYRTEIRTSGKSWPCTALGRRS